MLTHRKPACLSLISLDLPLWSVVETTATLYQKDQQRFHLLLNEPVVMGWEPDGPESSPDPNASRLLWFELSPSRAIATMQGQGGLSYRHLWERGMYGISRYWLRGDDADAHSQIRLRNYTRSLELSGRPLPDRVRLEYELWAGQLQLGRYVLHLEIDR
ncbi:MAG: hypothetical protein J7641_16835 [Cyanobacteria bacterium SID2]|nr:hypothetical protein [Cyanobacteria bacterium SID2]MBP0005003.1 hypothetical protein [Cyanobacteria bacterium SBC]